MLACPVGTFQMDKCNSRALILPEHLTMTQALRDVVIARHDCGLLHTGTEEGCHAAGVCRCFTSARLCVHTRNSTSLRKASELPGYAAAQLCVTPLQLLSTPAAMYAHDIIAGANI